MDREIHDVRFESHLAFEPTSAGVARTMLAGLLASAGVDRATIQNAELVLYEMVMNGVTHGAPTDDDTVQVSWSIDPHTLELRVHDDGHAGDVAVHRPTDHLPGGRGLAIVEALSSRWDVQRADHGTSVSAWLSLDDRV